MARADVVTLKNGDRITGTLVSVKGGNLELKSDVLGSLTIPLAQVESFTAEKPAAVMVKGEKTLQGQLQMESSGDWQVTANGKPQTVAATSVDVIMPVEAYDKLVEHTAMPWQDWKGGASLGVSIQRGDQQAKTFSTTLAAVRERPATPIFVRHWRTGYGLAMLLAHASQQGSSVTSNTFSTGLRQDYLFAPSDFVFGLVQFDHIGAQGLYLRQAYGGGYGHDVIKTSRTLFSVLGGITFVHEKFFTGAYNQGAEALLGEKVGIQLTKLVRLDHNVNFYPNLSNSGQYRFDTATTLAAKISNKFSVNAGVIDFYLSNPAAGSHKNNLGFTTGLGYTF
jgi:putative salt-induced outer membrane protein YdiY